MDGNTPKEYKNISEFARLQLGKLAKVGLSKLSKPSEGEGNYELPIRLVGGRVGRLRLRAGEHELGYKGAKVFEESPLTDRAILTALSVLEARPIGPEGKNKELVWRAARLRVRMQRVGLLKDLTTKRLIEASRRDPQLKGYNMADLSNAINLAYHEAWLRHYRPDFDALPENDKAALLFYACRHVDRLLEAARTSHAFFERGGVGGLPTREKGADPEPDIRAAELRDALGLSYRDIGEFLGIPLPQDYHIKGDHPEVRRMVNRGREREAPRRWVIDGQVEGGGGGTITYTLTPYDDGTTFERDFVYTMPDLLLALLDRLVLRRRIEAESAKALRRLKRTLEVRSPA